MSQLQDAFTEEDAITLGRQMRGLLNDPAFRWFIDTVKDWAVQTGREGIMGDRSRKELRGYLRALDEVTSVVPWLVEQGARVEEEKKQALKQVAPSVLTAFGMGRPAGSSPLSEVEE